MHDINMRNLLGATTTAHRPGMRSPGPGPVPVRSAEPERGAPLPAGAQATVDTHDCTHALKSGNRE